MVYKWLNYVYKVGKPGYDILGFFNFLSLAGCNGLLLLLKPLNQVLGFRRWFNRHSIGFSYLELALLITNGHLYFQRYVPLRNRVLWRTRDILIVCTCCVHNPLL